MTSAEGVGAGAKAALDLARSLCADIPNLNPILSEIDRLLVKLEQGILPLLLYNDMEHLQLRILDDLQGHYYYPVARELAFVYHNDKPFGDAVFDAFPSARLDIQNAGKCGVLGQSTAAVFHLMRAMEVGLKVMGRAAGIPYAPSWESYLNQFNAKFKVDHKSKPASWKRKEPLFRELCGDLLAIKYAWRNPTMHVVREYSFDEAVQVYKLVQAFMARLADQYRETGRPISAGLLGYQPS
jgi:hypothetical protein